MAFAEYVRFYDEQDQVIVHVEPHHLRLVYINVRASRQSSSATLIQCRIDEELEEMWITSLQVCETQRRQGVGCEMVQATEATARAMGISSMKIYPLADAVGFWKSLGYEPDERMSRVLQKTLC
jgi:N-acetylglutamate synthase-like GNAT family acetyltransferase